MGIIFSGMFGLGIVLFVAFDTTAHLEHILFGNILCSINTCKSYLLKFTNNNYGLKVVIIFDNNE